MASARPETIIVRSSRRVRSESVVFYLRRNRRQMTAIRPLMYSLAYISVSGGAGAATYVCAIILRETSYRGGNERGGGRWEKLAGKIVIGISIKLLMQTFVCCTAVRSGRKVFVSSFVLNKVRNPKFFEKGGIEKFLSEWEEGCIEAPWRKFCFNVAAISCWILFDKYDKSFLSI